MSPGRENEIKREAKRILDKFAKALAGIKTEDSFVEREEDRREEGDGKSGEKDFQKIFFENAPAAKKDCLLAERGKWK